MSSENPVPSHATHQPKEVGSLRAGDKQVSVYEQEGAVVVQINHEDTLLTAVHVSPENKLTLVFDASQLSTLGTPLPLSERSRTLAPTEHKEPEFPPIVIEGNLARDAKLRTGEHKAHKSEPELYFGLGYHPNPANTKEVIWYDVYFWGDLARAVADLSLKQGQAIQVHGENHTYKKLVNPRSGGDPVERDIHEIHGTDAPKKIKHKPRTLAETTTAP